MRRALLLVMLVACGDGRPGPSDATAPADADDGRGLVTVTIKRDTASVGGLPVYFQNADSSLVLVTRTHADGTANAFMRSGGFVTVSAPGLGELWTFAGVQAGDDLVIDDRINGGESTQLLLKIPAPPPADGIALITPCDSVSVDSAVAAPVPITLRNCADGIDMLVIAFTGQTVTDYLFRDSVQLGAGNLVTFAGPYVPVETSTLSVVNAPFPGVNFSQLLVGTNGRVFNFSDFRLANDGVMSAAFAMPQPPGTRLISEVTSSDFTALVDQHVLQWAPSGPRSELDLGEQMYRLTSAPRFDATSYTLRWTQDETGIAPNTVSALIDADFGRWHVLAPRGTEPVIQLPVLPGFPVVDANRTFGELLINFAVEGGSYAAPSTLVSWQLATPYPIVGATGRVIYEPLFGFGGGGGIE